MRNVGVSLEKKFHFMAYWAFDMFLHRSPKTALKNAQKLTSPQYFEVVIPGNF